MITVRNPFPAIVLRVADHYCRNNCVWFYTSYLTFSRVSANEVETSAVVVQKYEHTPSFTYRHRIIFEYRDQMGNVYRKDEAIFPSEYRHLRKGDIIDILYSARRPYVFAFKQAIEQSRAAAQSRREPPER